MAAVQVFLLCLLFSLHLLSECLCLSLSLAENDALLKFKDSLSNAGALSNWKPNSSPCKDNWVGVVCSKNDILSLRLNAMDLSGKIDHETFLHIPTLRVISFENNSFTGPIPDFSRLGSLKFIFLTGNQFSGTIPKDFFARLGSLKKLSLSANKFEGHIPDSLTKVPNLLELHLDDNGFTGPIPQFKQPSLTVLDVSKNKLEGPIPDSVSRFGAHSFADNEKLCGKPLAHECKAIEASPKDAAVILVPPSSDSILAPPKDVAGILAPPSSDNIVAPPSGESSSKTSSRAPIVFASIAVAVAVMLIVVFARKTRRNDQDDFSVLGREPKKDKKVESRANSTTDEPLRRAPSESGSRRGGDSRRGQRSGLGDIIMVNDEKGVFGLPDLMKAAAEVLGNGGLGSSYKAVMVNGLSVVVKRMKEMNRMGKDGYDAEMRRFGRLRHKNILTPLAFHYRREEKLLVSEYVPKGSLSYVMHGDRGTFHSDLNWPTRLKIVKGISNGLSFLHTEYASYDLPHGNLKSSNILLGEDYEPLLTDYAFHPLANPSNAVQAMFSFKTPDYLQYQEVSHKTDVYCLGIIILEILTGKLPSQYLVNGKGGTDVVQLVHAAISENREAEVIDPQIAEATNSLNQMLQLLQIGAACSESNPEQRLTMQEAIRRIEEVQV